MGLRGEYYIMKFYMLLISILLVACHPDYKAMREDISTRLCLGKAAGINYIVAKNGRYYAYCMNGTLEYENINKGK